MKQLFIQLKNKIKDRLDNIPSADFSKNSKALSYKIKDKIKSNLNKFGLDRYPYKFQSTLIRHKIKLKKALLNYLLMSHF